MKPLNDRRPRDVPLRARALPAQSNPGGEVSEGGRGPPPSWLGSLGSLHSLEHRDRERPKHGGQRQRASPVSLLDRDDFTGEEVPVRPAISVSSQDQGIFSPHARPNRHLVLAQARQQTRNRDDDLLRIV